MRSGLSQAQEQALMRPAADIMPPPGVAQTTKEIPYDYVAKFKLQGKSGNRVQDVINISVEGGFVAVAIGYSFIPASLGAPLSEIPVTSAQPIPIAFSEPSTTLVEIIAETIAGKLILETTNGTVTSTVDRAQTVSQLASIIRLAGDPRMVLQCFLLRLCGIDFKYSIVDSGTGRELQNQPIHNIAGLGESTGDRPFRPLAKPMLFLPRSTIRIEVEEISQGPIYTGAELFIVLHGYKILGYGTALP